MNRASQSILMPSGIPDTGAALFVSLVFLLILTLIGLAGMQNTALEEKMAGHLREVNLAFQAAESALKAGEASLSSAIPTFVCTGDSSESDGLYMNANPGAASDCPTTNGWPSDHQSLHPYSPDNEKFWNDSGTTNTDVVKLGLTGSQYDNLFDKPRYVIEIVSSGPSNAPGAGVSLEAGIPLLSTTKLYRITAHGSGVTGTSTAVTQSVVRQ